MTRRLLILKVLSLAILWLATGLLIPVYFRRSEYEYPEPGGRYFDYDTSTTYDEGSVFIIFILLILLLLISVVCTFLFVRGWIRKRK